jgi:hypothetical protein
VLKNKCKWRGMNSHSGGKLHAMRGRTCRKKNEKKKQEKRVDEGIRVMVG